MCVTTTPQIFVMDLWLAAVKPADFKPRSQYHQNNNKFSSIGNFIITKSKYQSISVAVEYVFFSPVLNRGISCSGNEVFSLVLKMEQHAP